MADIDKLMAEVRRLEEEAFQRGWEAALKTILTTATGALQTHSAPIKEPSPPQSTRQTAELPRGEPIVGVILSVIQERPGLRGIEIFREAVRRIPGSNVKTMDRSGRTALKRLKDRGLIHQRGKRWYPKQETENEAPTVGSSAP